MTRRGNPSGLSRLLDHRLPSNRFVMVIALLGAIVAGAWTVDFVWALRGAVAPFLAWAIARELDPDRPISAGVAAVGGAAALFLGAPDLVAAGVGLLAYRALAHTTGRPRTALDRILLVGAAVLAGLRPERWIVGAALVAALVVSDREHSDRVRFPSPDLLTAATMVLLAMTASLFADDPTPMWASFDVVDWVVLAMLAIAAFPLIRHTVITSETDAGDRLIHARHVRYARIAAIGTVLLTGAVLGGTTTIALSPIWVAVVAVGAVALTKAPSEKRISRTGDSS